MINGVFNMMQTFGQHKLTLPLKNLAGALLFTVFLGPIGLLYASSLGGIVMIVLGFIVACCKYTVPIVFVWLISCIWSVVAVNRYNRKIIVSNTIR
jgi:hypothetical protein